MTLSHHQRHSILDHLVDTYRKQKHSMSRRTFLQHSLALGLTVSSASSLLAACGSKSSEAGQLPNSITVLHNWTGVNLVTFKKITDAYTSKYAVQVQLEATNNLDTTLDARLKANNPPDLAILSGPARVQALASQGKLKELNPLLDMDRMHKEYAQYWLDLASYQDSLYGVFFRGTNKGTIWYNPNQFDSNHYETPLSSEMR